MRLKFFTLVMVGFTALSAGVLAAEWRSFSGAKNPRAWASSGDTSDRRVPFSMSALQAILLSCDAAMSAPLAQFQTRQNLLKTAGACGEFASRVLGWMPSHGFAQFVAAQAANHSNEWAARDNFLQSSQYFTPFEGWLAQRRYTLAVNLAEPPGFTYTVDAATLLTTQSGAELLAAFYVHRPASRPVLASLAATASPRDQARFLNQLRQKQAAK